MTVTDRQTDDFATWVTERRPALLRAARAISGDPDTAEDLLHSALARVLPRWSALRDTRAADAYVRRAMVNQQHSWYRRASHRHERPVAQPPEPGPQRRPDPEPAPGEGRLLWPLVAGLPAQQRTAVVLRFYEGLSVAEAAAALGCSTGTVKSNTSRGLAALRRRLEADDAWLDLAG